MNPFFDVESTSPLGEVLLLVKYWRFAARCIIMDDSMVRDDKNNDKTGLDSTGNYYDDIICLRTAEATFSAHDNRSRSLFTYPNARTNANPANRGSC